MITYRATCNVPVKTCTTVAGWLAAHRRAVDARPWQRAATCWVKAVLVLRWFKDGTALWLLARDAKVSQATAYRYLHEGLDVVAVHVPDLHQVLAEGREQGWSHVCLDGTLAPTDRCTEKSPDTGYDLWYSGKHKRHGANVQVLTDHTGYPVWVSSARTRLDPRRHRRPRTRPARAVRHRSSRVADPDRQGLHRSSIGIKVPCRRRVKTER